MKLIEDRLCVGDIPLEEDESFDFFSELFEYKKAIGKRNKSFLLEAVRKETKDLPEQLLTLKFTRTEINGGEKDAEKDFETEVEILESLDHPHVIKFI